MQHTYPFSSELPKLYSFTEAFIFEHIMDGHRVLDIGCGDGWLANRLTKSRNLIELIGFDISDLAITEATRRFTAPCLKFLIGDAEDANFTARLGTFDTIIVRNTFHHFVHKPEFLKHIIRQLNPAGELVLLDLDKEANHCLIGLLITFLRSIQHNGVKITWRIAWSTKFFHEKRFRQHRIDDVKLLQKDGWFRFTAITEKARTILGANCTVGRVGSILGWGGCYYIVYKQKARP